MMINHTFLSDSMTGTTLILCLAIIVLILLAVFWFMITEHRAQMEWGMLELADEWDQTFTYKCVLKSIKMSNKIISSNQIGAGS